MTRIDFYSHVSDKEKLACVLCAKAMASGLKVFVLTQDLAATERMNQLLWEHPPAAFMPHGRAADAQAGDLPVIVDHDSSQLPHDGLLINMTAEVPAFFSRFERLVEIVSLDETDAAQARNRYRAYQRRGYQVKNHSMQAKTNS